VTSMDTNLEVYRARGGAPTGWMWIVAAAAGGCASGAQQAAGFAVFDIRGSAPPRYPRLRPRTPDRVPIARP